MSAESDAYTVKEILNLVIIPRLDQLDSKIDKIESESLTPSLVEQQFGQLFQSHKARGFKTWELWTGGIALLITVFTFGLNLYLSTT